VRYHVGVDGGGTRTTVAVANEAGVELVRHAGPAGLVDPRYPAASAETLASVIREAVAKAGLTSPAAALCAGLAGVGNVAERQIVQGALTASGVAERVVVRTDGEIALEGAFGGGPGILLIAGTGSVAYGRSEDGRTERCGGWGMLVGDEGSGYEIGRSALRAALQSEDGRGDPTMLLPVLLGALKINDPRAIPPWIGRVEKAEVAALVPHVMRCASSGDAVAAKIVKAGARELALHAAALVGRLGPWSDPPSVVFLGGVFRDEMYPAQVTRELAEHVPTCRVRAPAADAVQGALQFARALVLE
jgi:glucosamine kinase